MHQTYIMPAYDYFLQILLELKINELCIKLFLNLIVMEKQPTSQHMCKLFQCCLKCFNASECATEVKAN